MGDTRYAYALVTVRFLGQLFGGPETVPPEVAVALEGEPDRIPRFNRLSLIAVSEVVALTDERGGTVAETLNADETFRDLLVFVRAGDCWLIDEQITLSDRDAAMPSP